MSRIAFTVESSAQRWWVAIEDGDHEFQSPTRAASFDLPQGEKHAAIYYAQGAPGDGFKLTGKNDDGKVLVEIDRTVSANGFAYGHKLFVP